MRRLFAGLLVIALAACGTYAEFWRPISEPNLLMSIDRAQAKLDFDLSQCNCGIYPANVSPMDRVAFQSDNQRLAQTSITNTEHGGDCVQRPSLVVAECMRARGWEVTKCTGRMPLAGGGALCAATVPEE